MNKDITESNNWSKCRKQVTIECPLPTENPQYNLYIYGSGYTLEGVTERLYEHQPMFWSPRLNTNGRGG